MGYFKLFQDIRSPSAYTIANVTLMVLIITMEIHLSRPDFIYRNALVGGTVMTYCDGLVLPPRTIVKAVEIRNDKDTIFFHDSYAKETYPGYSERYRVFSTGVRPHGNYLKISNDFNISLYIDDVKLEDKGEITCQVTYISRNGGQFQFKFWRKTILSLFVYESGENSKCKDDWIRYIDVMNKMQKSCLKVFFYATSWKHAREDCVHAHMGDLVVVKGWAKDNFISRMTGVRKGSGFWIGLSQSSSKWGWVNGTSMSTYQGWKSPKDSKGGDCAQKGLKGGGKWSAVSCDDLLTGYICERSTDAESTIWTTYFKLKVAWFSLAGLLVVMSLIICLLIYRHKRANKACIYHWRKIRKFKQIRRKLQGKSYVSESTTASEAASSGVVVAVYDSELNEMVDLQYDMLNSDDI